jgi:uncharacterized protein
VIDRRDPDPGSGRGKSAWDENADLRPRPLGRKLVFPDHAEDRFRVRDHFLVERPGGEVLVFPERGGWARTTAAGMELLARLDGLTRPQAEDRLGLPWDRLINALEDPIAWDLITLPGHRPRELAPRERGTGFALLVLKVTGGCNLRCAYCYDETARAGTELTATAGRDAIRMAVDAAADGLNLIFHGGEPFLVLDLLKELSSFARRYASERGKALRLNVQTNGTLLSDDAIAYLDEYEVGVGVSVDGPGTLNACRIDHRGASTIHRVREGIARLQDSGRSVSVVTVITSHNAASLDDIVLCFQRWSIRSVKFSPFLKQGNRGSIGRRMAPDPAETASSLIRIIDGITNREIHGIVVEDVCELIACCLSTIEPSICRPSGPCGAGRDMIAVCGDQIYACDCLVHDRFRLGKLGEVASVGELATSAALDPLEARKPARLTPCSRCALAELCGGTMTCRAFWSNGDPFTVDADECRLNQEVFVYLLERLTESRVLADYFLSWDRAKRGSGCSRVDA